ncbi:MAG: FAD-dependent oxidoreductase [Acidobacteria bacterium]|nr:FAD-dependent oxidoreductase [Acidobacteriota bacterium]
MANDDVRPSALWLSATTAPRYPKLDADAETDVVIVGGGITGLTAGYLLAKAGTRVIVLERDRCVYADTGHTSAHLTMVTDARLSELTDAFGRDHAQAVWDAGLAAIGQIAEIVREEQIDADFAWVDGYLHVPIDGDVEREREAIERDATLALDFGFDVDLVEAVPLMGTPGLRVIDQARIHPRKYLTHLARAITSMGGAIHETSSADEFESQPLSVKANGHTIRCTDVVLATHNPLVGLTSTADAALLQTKLALYTSYVLAADVPKGVVDDALWWDTADPYRYWRVEPHADRDVVIVGGEDHKTGQVTDTRECHARLEQWLHRVVPKARVTHRWSGQVIETPDGLPYIGSNAEHQYFGTGYSGNGLTFGTLAAMMIADAIAGRKNPWSDLFHPSRKAIRHGLWEYVKENVDYPYYMLRDRFAGADSRPLRSIRRGEGRVIERGGEKVAAYRDGSGAVTLRSAVCTHMGCIVGWNTSERTWDCPCHGSRFKPTGDVLSGPAESPLGEAK